VEGKVTPYLLDGEGARWLALIG
jgi:hypothetical protein